MTDNNHHDATTPRYDSRRPRSFRKFWSPRSEAALHSAILARRMPMSAPKNSRLEGGETRRSCGFNQRHDRCSPFPSRGSTNDSGGLHDDFGLNWPARDSASSRRLRNGCAAPKRLVQRLRITLGPKSKSVLIQKSWGAPIVCNDGVTIAKEIDLKDPEENLGAPDSSSSGGENRRRRR